MRKFLVIQVASAAAAILTGGVLLLVYDEAMFAVFGVITAFICAIVFGKLDDEDTEKKRKIAVQIREIDLRFWREILGYSQFNDLRNIPDLENPKIRELVQVEVDRFLARSAREFAISDKREQIFLELEKKKCERGVSQIAKALNVLRDMQNSLATAKDCFWERHAVAARYGFIVKDKYSEYLEEGELQKIEADIRAVVERK